MNLFYTYRQSYLLALTAALLFFGPTFLDFFIWPIEILTAIIYLLWLAGLVSMFLGILIIFGSILLTLILLTGRTFISSTYWFGLIIPCAVYSVLSLVLLISYGSLENRLI